MIFFERSKKYRHENCLDVDIFILSSYEGSATCKLLVKYWNRHSKAFHEQFDWIKVKKSNLERWTEIGETNL